jgi:hypothetical protein
MLDMSIFADLVAYFSTTMMNLVGWKILVGSVVVVVIFGLVYFFKR